MKEAASVVVSTSSVGVCEHALCSHSVTRALMGLSMNLSIPWT